MTAGAGSDPAAADVSVLMPVHGAVHPGHFAAALDSVLDQTVPPREVVVVVDGPVSADHLHVLDRRPGVRRVVLPVNRGAGAALARGLAECSDTWVARADADDLSEPHRLEQQLEVLATSGADVCSSPMTEFVGSPEHVVGVRRCPAAHEDFARLLRLRNPVNHPTAVFRRALAVRAGGYRPLPYLEDYDLWARMLREGAVFVGTPQPTVRFRADGMLDRRTRPEAVRAERELQRRLRSYGLVGPVRARTNLAVRSVYLRLPRPVLERAYRLVFRR